MSGKSPNYYDVLGVSRNATKKEITARYTKLIRENHPDKFEGLKNKYEANNDRELLKVLEKAIAEAEERAKEINEAYSVLSNTSKRRSYDSSLINIVITPTRISLGSIKQGGKATASFIIENRGAKVKELSIDWQYKKAWGDFDIEPDPDNGFPIKVTIKVSTISLAPGIFSGQVNIEIDGEQYYVPIDFKVIPSPVVSYTKVKSGIPIFGWFRGKSKGFWRMLTISTISVVAIGSLVIATVSVSKKNTREAIAQFTITPKATLQQPTVTPTYVPTPTEPPGVTLEELESTYSVQNSTASRLDLEGEISLFSTNPEELVKVERLDREPVAKHNNLYGYYKVVNLSKYSVVQTYCDTIAPDEYNSLPVIDTSSSNLYPGGTRFLLCGEYKQLAEWVSSQAGYWVGGCMYVDLENQIGSHTEEFCIELPILPIDLSSLVKISAQRLPTLLQGYTEILEIKFEIGNIPYPLQVLDGNCCGYLWYKQDPVDNRLFVPYFQNSVTFKSRSIEKIYLFLEEGRDVPYESCFRLSNAYVPSKKVCVNTP